MRKQSKRITEATERPKEATEELEWYSHTRRTRKQKGSVFVYTGDIRLVLTPKQLEFMERLSENPRWGEHKENGEYTLCLYAEELSDSMNTMTVGAVTTTLREKGILNTKKVRFKGEKTCIFALTEKGKEVYRFLAKGETKWIDG